MHVPTDDLRGSSANLDLYELLRQPTSELLGVSDEAFRALKQVGIQTIFDLGTSNLFGTAQSAVEMLTFGSVASRFGMISGDVLSNGSVSGSSDAIANLPIERLRILTAQQAQELSSALSVQTIRDLAFWPPRRAARRLAGHAAGSTFDPELFQVEELRPRLGEYPTERVYYTTLVMLHMEQQAQQNALALDQPVSLDPAVQNPSGFNKPAVGALITFSHSWYAQGLTLGQMLHSLALAPGEATRIAIIDWSRRTRARATESITEAEQLDDATQHNRAMSEVQQATASDFQAGGARSSSFSHSDSRSTAVSAGTGFFTSLFASGDVSATSQEANTRATAESSSWSVGNRSILGTMTQNVNDRAEQHSASVRNRRASAVREVSQSEHEEVSTRIVANYNHMHALTVQYYEVVQIYRTLAQLYRADRVLFVPMQLLDFSPANRAAGMKVVDRFRAALIRAALNRQVESILLDGATAVAIKPASSVSIVVPRPGWAGTLRAVPPRAPLDVSAVATATATGQPAVTSAASSQPFAIETARAASREWDANAIAVASRVLDRSIIRRGSDVLYVPDDTELLAVSFDSIKVGTVRLDYVGSDTTVNQILSVSTDSARVAVSRSVRFIDLEAIHVSKQEAPAASGTMTLHCGYLGRRFSLPPIPIQLNDGTAVQQVVAFENDQADRQRELLIHLQSNRTYYSQAVFRSLDSATLTMVLSQYQWNGRPLIDQVEPNPVTVAGNYLVLRAPVAEDEDSGVIDNGRRVKWAELLVNRGLYQKLDADGQPIPPPPDQRLIPIPSAGVFAEAVLGRSNSAEKLDITRFWNWQDSPIPLQPTEIAPVDTGTRATPENLMPSQLSSPVLNILNPASLPDPSGLNAALRALSNLNFRDMSGLAGTQGLVQAGMAGTLQGATSAGQLASDNMRTEAQKAVSMGQVYADIAKAAMAAAVTAITGIPAAGAGGTSVQGISGDGARINHGRDMDSRGVPSPDGASDSDASGGAAGDVVPGEAGGAASADAPPASAPDTAGAQSMARKRRAYSREGAYADQGAHKFSPAAIHKLAQPPGQSETPSPIGRTGDVTTTVSDIARTKNLAHDIIEGTHVVGSVAEVAAILGGKALLGARLLAVAEVLGPIGHVAMVVLAAYEVLEAFNTGERITNAQGVCYGIMFEVVGRPDADLIRPNWPLTDYEWENQLDAFREGLRKGRRLAQDPRVRGRIQVAIAAEDPDPEVAAWGVLNALWHAIRPRLPKGHLTAEWIRWPEPGPHG